MMFRTFSSLLVCATLTACAYTPPTLTNRLDIRQVPYTPDSGTVAIRCGKLLDGYTDTAQDNVLVVIRDGRIHHRHDDAQRHTADRMYYVYTPYPKIASAWTPWVKNYGCKNSFDRGAQLEVVWLDR